MIYLDSHVVVWLYAGLVPKISQPVRDLMNDHEIMISPIVCLEIQYLHEIGRVTDDANTIVADLANRLGLNVCDQDFQAIVRRALTFSWTRGPFDRLIVANAGLNDAMLITKDQNILTHYAHARW